MTGHYSTGHVSDFGTTTSFRWFSAKPEWTFVGQNFREPTYLECNGKLRYDLLALEIFMTSVAAGGLLIVTRRAARS